MGSTIFGVRLDHISSREELRARCQALLEGDRTGTIFTPNPEILLRAKRDPGYAKLLNQADLVLPDGVGILMVQAIRRVPRVGRWPGVDAAELLLELLARDHGTVLFLGGRLGAARDAAARLWTRWPSLSIETAGAGVPFRPDGTAVSPEEAAEIERRIAEVGPRVVLVGLGAPKQERWIARHSAAFPSVRVMMGIGGALDMWAGRVRRAPKPVSGLGLEWAWRLLRQPSRLPRTLNATILFPWYALRDRSVG